MAAHDTPPISFEAAIAGPIIFAAAALIDRSPAAP
jgi:hypothetical protein